MLKQRHLIRALQHEALLARIRERSDYPKPKEIPMTTRAKFRCSSVERFELGANVKLSVVYDPNGNGENANFTKATPCGDITMRVDNPAAAVQFEPGKVYYVDFTEAVQ